MYNKAVFRTLSAVTLVLVLYVIQVTSQNTSGDTGNPQSTDLANASDGNPENQPLINVQPDTPPTKQKQKRRPVKRRRRPLPRRRMLRKKPRPPIQQEQVPDVVENVINGGDVVKDMPPEKLVREEAVKKNTATVVDTAVVERTVESAPIVDMPAVAKPVIDKPAMTKAVMKKPALEKPALDTGGFGQDSFFEMDMFAETTTIAKVEGPPPEFSVVKVPKKKVMPVVDTKNAIAYDGTPCNESFRNHETDKTQYLRKYAEGVWKPHDCPPNLGAGLVWRQDLCACGEELVAVDPDDWCAQEGFIEHSTNRHKYMRKHHGENHIMDCPANLVWSQVKCQCIFDTTAKERPIEKQVTFQCKTILQLEFEGSSKNSAEGYRVNPVDLRRRGKLPRIRYRKVPGSTNKAAMIVSQPLEFQAFRGNDFQKQITYALAFKVSPRHEGKNNFMSLITDECIGSPGGQNKNRPPSISLEFQPNTRKFRLQFRTESTEINELIPGATPDSYGWYKVIVYFENNTVTIEVNGQIIFTQSDVKGKIPQNKCPLYIAGRGQGFDRSLDFYGYLDNVYIVKNCRFHEANIKFL